jgi:hypothetical protein
MLFFPRFINLTHSRASRERHLTMCFLSRCESVQSFGTICRYFHLFIVPWIFLFFLLPCIFLEGMSVSQVCGSYLCPKTKYLGSCFEHLDSRTRCESSRRSGSLVYYLCNILIHIYWVGSCLGTFNDKYLPNRRYVRYFVPVLY